jgi:hypothetical protein
VIGVWFDALNFWWWQPIKLLKANSLQVALCWALKKFIFFSCNWCSILPLPYLEFVPSGSSNLSLFPNQLPSNSHVIPSLGLPYLIVTLISSPWRILNSSETFHGHSPTSSKKVVLSNLFDIELTQTWYLFLHLKSLNNCTITC